MCADDTHGAPIMIAAEKAGKTPQEFVAEIAATRKDYLDGFHLSIDNWHSTDSPENTELAQDIYRKLKAAGFIATRTIEQFFDPVKEHVPAGLATSRANARSGAQRPVRRLLRKLRRGVRADGPQESVLHALGATPEMRSSDIFSSSCRTRSA